MASQYTIAQVIQIGKISTYLSVNYNQKRALFGSNLFKASSPTTIQMVTDALDWGNSGGAQTAASLRGVADYLIWLCGKFYLEATHTLGIPGGGTVDPGGGGGGGTTSIYPFVISSSDFESDGVTFLDSKINGENLMIFINEWTQQWLFPPLSFTYVTGGGIKIVLNGFDANTNDYTIIISNVNKP